MNTRLCIAALVAAALTTPVAAQEATKSLPTVHAQAVLQVVDCANRSLPSQREVGEWTGQHNFSQVYDTRTRLMAEIGRSCRKAGIEQVQIVSRTDSAARSLGLVAVNSRQGH